MEKSMAESLDDAVKLIEGAKARLRHGEIAIMSFDDFDFFLDSIEDAIEILWNVLRH